MYRITKFENVSENEELLINRMEELLRKKMEKDYPTGQTKRDAHPKHLGVLQAQFIVDANIPEELRVGIFREAQTYPAWIRISNSKGQIQSDKKKDFRGFAIKILGVEGDKYIVNGEKNTQDFILMSNPTMPLGTVKLFHDAVYYSIRWSPIVFLFRMLLSGKGYILKQTTQGKKHDTSPLDIRYWSTTPYLFSENQVVKYSIVPTSQYRSDLPTQLSDDYLTDNLQVHLQKHEATFDFLIQFQKDPTLMPVEDSGIEWKEKDSPFIKVGQIRIPVQNFRTEERINLAEELSFSPGNALLEHQPIGGINRARLKIYQNLSDFRLQRDHRKRFES